MSDLEKQIELHALITEREGMIAENLFSQSVDRGVQYGESAFFTLADKMRALK
jgi:hypothetical protein